jgi:hypothetical protein
MKIRKLNEAYDKIKTKKFLDGSFNFHEKGYVVCEYPGGAGHELFEGSLDKCLEKVQIYRNAKQFQFNHIFIIERETISRHIDEDELRELLDAKKYNL